jgi:alpha-D-ribose 1-methylphosphonate 5-triphosphate synthase subunit PhnI
MSEEQDVPQRIRRTTAEVKQIVGEFQSSGMSRSQFCRGRGLTFGVLNRYLKRMQAAVDGSASRDRLVAVEWNSKKTSAERARGCGLSVVLGSGREITVNTGFDAATLQRLVEVLETM